MGAVGSRSRLMMLRDGAAQPLNFGDDGATEPLLNSAATAWAGVPFELHATRPTAEGAVVSPLDGEHQLRIVVDGGFEGVVRSDGRELAFRTAPGFVSLHTGRSTGTVRVAGSARTLVIGLPPEWIDRFRREGPPSMAGICRVGGQHETARLLALAMCEEVRQGSQSGSLFAQSLSTALLSYVFDRLPARALDVRGALSEVQCRRLSRHIEERLGEELQLTELARICGVGLRHFSSLFRHAYGMTPHRFVLTQRLERGAALLSTSNLDIAEVALVVGFSSQSHFTTAFRRQHGVTPASYRSQRRRSVGVFRNSKDGFRP